MLSRKLSHKVFVLRGRAALVALAAAAILLAAGVLLTIADERGYRSQKLGEVTVEAQILASTVAAALVFNDRKAAQESIDALKASPATEAAGVYDSAGDLFASYTRSERVGLPARAPPIGAGLSGDMVAVTLPVIEDNARLGTVYLAVVTDPVQRRLVRYLGVGLLVTMAALLVVVLGTAHSALAAANAELARQASDLAAANRSLQAQIEEREKAEEALRQSQKMEAIGRITGGIAHDFNNLLTVVAGNLDLVCRIVAKAPDSDPSRHRLQRLLEAAQRGLARGEQLTRQLLGFSRRQRMQLRVVNINQTIAEFAPLIRQAIGEAIELRLVLGDDDWRCKLDRAQFESAILNLAINARDASEGGGTLTIATRLADPDPLGPDAGRREVAIAVSDTGSGMTAETMRRIFEPFFTTKPSGKGSGLGLAQVWGFATASGGSIKVDSEPGRGSTFSLLLPLVDEPVTTEQADVAAAGLAEDSEQRGSETILVVEDEEDVRDVAAATLQRLGYRVLLARDGHEALEVIARRPDVDLLFTDFVMPRGLNGGELARQALRWRPQLKILITSGYTREGNASSDGTSVEGFPLIPKPYRATDLAQRVRAVLDEVATVQAT